MAKSYAELSETVLGSLVAFPCSYIVVAGFSQINALLTKQRNRLDEVERGDLRLKLTNPQHCMVNLPI